MAETFAFKTELKQLLDLIIHSLYTRKEIFLRELISNSADAIDRLRFQSLTEPGLLGDGGGDFAIDIIPDATAGTLTIRDNGIGMTHDQIVDHLGTIARSGTRQFLQSLQESDAQQRPELIGRFGVGFYASFMVADKVTVVSRGAGHEHAVRWESDGQGAFTIEPAERSGRGTDVILHLRDDAKEFLEPWRLSQIVKQYSDFIEHPIRIQSDPQKPSVDAVNSRQAIWLRPKGQVKPDELSKFYQSLTRDGQEPLETIHVAAEGVTEFRALMFIPAAADPFEAFGGPEKASGLDLYVRRVLIQHRCEELAPSYLRFVRGVVDSADLPLNVSRETLQHNPIMSKIRSNVVNRILKSLEDLRDNDPAKYRGFYDAFGKTLKEGIGQDFANQERLADLLLLESMNTPAGERTTLAKYVGAMGEGQEQIHYLVGETREQLEHSPYLESLRAAGQDVLLLSDPIDEYVVGTLNRYKDKQLAAADRGKVPTDLDAEQVKAFAPMLSDLATRLADDVKQVRLSGRLKESASVLVADEGAPTAHLERLLERMGRSGDTKPKRTLELNPSHAVVRAMAELYEASPTDPRIEQVVRVLLDQAVIAEGSRPKDPAAMAKRINDALAASLKAGKSA